MRIAINALLLGAAAAVSSAASAKPDEQVWGQVAATVKLSDHWGLYQEFVVRDSDQRHGLYEVESNTMLNYRVHNVTVGAGYTHDPQYAGGKFTAMERRAREQLTFDNLARLGRGKFSARMRVEERWRDGVEGTGWRLRPYVKYSLPLAGRTALNLSSEPFFNLDRTVFQRQTGLDRVRNLVTVSTPLSKTLTGEAGYMNQHGFVRGGADTSDNIAYLALSLNL